VLVIRRRSASVSNRAPNAVSMHRRSRAASAECPNYLGTATPIHESVFKNGEGSNASLCFKGEIEMLGLGLVGTIIVIVLIVWIARRL